ncbi:pilus assembly protein [Ferrimonas pelagia]|uniref:PilC/PilY family type IV pilus protein n=1 Tax=Ferrimonas pelagia TaxID=1177826 RepID=A0ABP9EE14_9GAMM
MKRKIGVWGAAFSVAAALLPLAADDTELYVAGGSVVATSRPQVLIVFDTSGSMKTEEEVTPEPFDPNRDYTGNNGRRIFYVRGEVKDYPDPDDTTRYFAWEQNACASSLLPHPEDNSLSILAYEGSYTDKFRAFKYNRSANNNNRYWRNLPNSLGNGRPDYVIECAQDLASGKIDNAPQHPNSNLTGTGFATNIDRKTPFDGSTSALSLAERLKAAEIAESSVKLQNAESVTLFTENYLRYLQNAGETRRSRIDIAKDTIVSLLNSTPGVDFGLAVFNYNRYANDSGGRIVAGIETLDDQRRADLIDTVKGLPAENWTPLCESLFEAYRYYSGKAPMGADRAGDQRPVADASIVNAAGQYVSPMLDCQRQAYVILITDGVPTYDNDFDDTIKTEFGIGSEDYYDLGRNSSYGRYNYLPQVAKYMFENDLNAQLQGDQKVVTYTIGFSKGADDAAGVLSDTALKGGGDYYAAADALALRTSLQSIFSDILATNSSFTSPSIAANSFDRTQTLDAVYYGMFLPSDRPRWRGNLKKLQVSATGQIQDAGGQKAINANGNIEDGACTFWTLSASCSDASSGGDGNDVLVGGAAESVYLQATRRILTEGQAGQALVPLTQASLSQALGGESALLTQLELDDATPLAGYVQWLQGVDVDDEDGDLSVTDRRQDVIGDPLHSKPLAIGYGDTFGVRILMGTNQGYLHMFRDAGNTLTESWAYLPAEMVRNTVALRTNDQTGGHTVYGIDGSAVAYIHDADRDGNIETGDRVWAYFGLRRGGRGYYALDVSDPDNPKSLWHVDATTLGLEELGQSWSEPVITRIPGYGDKPVFIIGGGYDPNKDTKAVGSADSMGRAVFILDAETGAVIHRFVGSTKDAKTTPFPGEDSIPAKLSALDSDADGVTDRLYATDTGGNVWRFDLPSGDRQHWSVFKLAQLGGDSALVDRRFHAEVSVAQTSFELVESVVVNQGQADEARLTTSTEFPYDAVAVGSGNRAHPNGAGTADMLFVLQDRRIKTQTFGTSDNPAPEPITLANLYSVNDDPIGSVSDDEAKLAEQLKLGEKLGWSYSLAAKEKALSAPVVIAGMAYFTTFTPGNLSAAQGCVAEGQGQLYAFNLQEGLALGRHSLGARLPDTPQVLVPPPPESVPEDWDPQLFLVGVGAGEDQTGTLATEQYIIPSRVYYHYGGE